MSLTHIHDWVFDLDNTLYPATCDLFAEIDTRMTGFVAEYLGLDPVEARKVQKTYYREHGTTLAGLMSMHGMDPDEFLHHVHEIDLEPVQNLPTRQALHDALIALPGRKLVYTNGSRRHAMRVLDAMGLTDVFHGSFAIEDANYQPKPQQHSYDAFCELHVVTPSNAIFFEDMSRNLAPAKAMGFTTCLVHSDKDWSHEPEGARPATLEEVQTNDAAAHIDYITGDLAGFLDDALALI